jgi:hypothetical protein
MADVVFCFHHVRIYLNHTPAAVTGDGLFIAAAVALR